MMTVLRGFSFMIVTLLMYLVIPLLGWGILDWQGFFSSAPRTGYAVTVIILGVLVGYQAMNNHEGIRGGRGDERKRSRRQSVVSSFMIGFLYFVLFFLPFADRRNIVVMNIGFVPQWIGLIFTIFGLGLIFWSGIALGKMYSTHVTVQEHHHLVTAGLYRWIRHPRYLGVIALAFGSTFLFRSWPMLVICNPLVFILLMRIKDEEDVMRKEFNEEWESYCRRSWKLIPYIY
jgi:protein-S-isoprenylcysteine O-methyltransferase Ste14